MNRNSMTDCNKRIVVSWRDGCDDSPSDTYHNFHCIGLRRKPVNFVFLSLIHSEINSLDHMLVVGKRVINHSDHRLITAIRSPYGDEHTIQYRWHFYAHFNRNHRNRYRKGKRDSLAFQKRGRQKSSLRNGVINRNIRLACPCSSASRLQH